MKQSNAAFEITRDSHEQTHGYHKERITNYKKQQTLHTLPFKYSKASDEAIIGLYVNNSDEEAFNEIVSRYGDIIIGFAMKLCRNSHDAEEVKQDVLLILATKLNTFKGNSKFSTWLYKVTLNTCYKYLNDSNKRTKREINFEECYLNEYPTQPNWAKTPDEIILCQEKMDIIERAVDELNESNKKIFNLKDINGLSNAEVGVSMGMSISAVKSRVLRTRLAIKEKISGYFQESSDSTSN